MFSEVIEFEYRLSSLYLFKKYSLLVIYQDLLDSTNITIDVVLLLR